MVRPYPTLRGWAQPVTRGAEVRSVAVFCGKKWQARPFGNKRRTKVAWVDEHDVPRSVRARDRREGAHELPVALPRPLTRRVGDLRVVLTPALFDPLPAPLPAARVEKSSRPRSRRCRSSIRTSCCSGVGTSLRRSSATSTSRAASLSRRRSASTPTSRRASSGPGMGKTAELWSTTHWRAGQALESLDLEKFKAAIADQFRL